MHLSRTLPPVAAGAAAAAVLLRFCILSLGSLLIGVGVSLCCDPAVAASHMEALQAFDMIAQKQRGLAALLRADCPVTALAALGLDELKLRLGSPFDRP